MFLSTQIIYFLIESARGENWGVGLLGFPGATCAGCIRHMPRYPVVAVIIL